MSKRNDFCSSSPSILLLYSHGTGLAFVAQWIVKDYNVLLYEVLKAKSYDSLVNPDFYYNVDICLIL